VHCRLDNRLLLFLGGLWQGMLPPLLLLLPVSSSQSVWILLLLLLLLPVSSCHLVWTQLLLPLWACQQQLLLCMLQHSTRLQACWQVLLAHCRTHSSSSSRAAQRGWLRLRPLLSLLLLRSLQPS
jgi:hypothetical protein